MHFNGPKDGLPWKYDHLVVIIISSHVFVAMISKTVFMLVLSVDVFVATISQTVFMLVLSLDVFVAMISQTVVMLVLSLYVFIAMMSQTVFMLVLSLDVFVAMISQTVFMLMLSVDGVIYCDKLLLFQNPNGGPETKPWWSPRGPGRNRQDRDMQGSRQGCSQTGGFSLYRWLNRWDNFDNVHVFLSM